MAKAKLFRRIMHRPADLRDMVADVPKYPKFINLLSAARVTKRKKVSDTVETFEADATVRYKFISETFHSAVKVDKAANTVSVHKPKKGGAVKSLKNEWIFHELSDGSTLVEFFVDVKLAAFPLEMVLRDKFDKAGKHLIGVFETHAGHLFEKVGDPDLDVEAEMARLGLSHNLV